MLGGPDIFMISKKCIHYGQIIPRKISKIGDRYQMSDFKARLKAANSLSAGALTQTLWGSLQRSQIPRCTCI